MTTIIIIIAGTFLGLVATIREQRNENAYWLEINRREHARLARKRAIRNNRNA